MIRWPIAALAAVVLAAPALGSEEVERIRRAAEVLEDVARSRDEGIPRDLLAKAECAGIVPSMKKGGFIFGGKYGKGVLLCRQGDSWSGPSTVRIEGGSVGLQIGGGAVDLVLLVMNKRGVEKLMASQFTLGGEGSVMAGPVGRSASAQTDAYMNAEILSWSKSRGVFAGVALQGATLRVDNKDNHRIYGKPVRHDQILKGEIAAPAAADELIARLNRYSKEAE